MRSDQKCYLARFVLMEKRLAGKIQKEEVELFKIMVIWQPTKERLIVTLAQTVILQKVIMVTLLLTLCLYKVSPFLQ